MSQLDFQTSKLLRLEPVSFPVLLGGLFAELLLARADDMITVRSQLEKIKLDIVCVTACACQLWRKAYPPVAGGPIKHDDCMTIYLNNDI